MKWFSEGVAPAIAACRQDSALFIVYVYDESAGSKVTDEAWSSEEVSQLLSSKKYVALKVMKDSLEYRQFSQLYAVFLIPSIFCIGSRGQNLLTMNGAQTATQLKEKLNDAFCKFDADTQPPPPPSSSTEEPVATATAGPAITATPSTSSATPTESSATNKSKEETLKRYQEKIKEQRQKREKDEIKDDGNREVQRREYARNIAKLKQEREEQQNQTWLKKRQEEREEAKRAREAIKLKLEQDKLERQAQQRRSGHLQQPRENALPSSPSSISGPSSNMCRIQLKLPAGNATVLEMSRTDTLAVLRERVAKELNEDAGNVLLCRSYPRKELDHDLDSNTMLELQLCPSGVVIVRMKKSVYALSSNSESGSGVVGILMSILHFLIFCLSAIKNFVVGLFSSGKSPDPSPDQPHIPQQRQMQSINSSDRSKQGDSGLRVRKFRQEDYHDDSEEDATYNGNSTQQQ